MDKVIGLLAMLFLLPFVFPLIAFLYSIALRRPIWRASGFIAPSLAVSANFIACFAGVISVIRRDNEHGIATVFGALHIVAALVVLLLWCIVADKQGALKESRFLAWQIPLFSLLLASFCTLFTLLSPYTFLDRLSGPPVFYFPHHRQGRASHWPGKWRELNREQEEELESYAKAFAPWSDERESSWLSLEEFFDVSIKIRRGQYQMRLVSKDPSQLTYVATIREANGEVGLYGPHCTVGEELQANQRLKVDAAIKSYGKFVFIAPRGMEIQILDGRFGLDGFFGERDEGVIRLIGERALVIKELVDLRGLETSHFLLYIEIESSTIEKAYLVPCPGQEMGRFLKPKELSLINESLASNGRFAQGHDYSSSLETLHDDIFIQLSENEEKYFFTLSDRSEHRHLINFKIDKVSGAIERYGMMR